MKTKLVRITAKAASLLEQISKTKGITQTYFASEAIISAANLKKGQLK